MAKYYALKAHRSGADRSMVKRGDTVDMDANTAAPLVEAGILSKEKPEARPEPRDVVDKEGAEPYRKMVGDHANKMAAPTKNKKK
jgi:hypothetical protein